MLRLSAGSIYVGQTLFASSLSILLIPYVTHYVSPEDYGAYILSCVYSLLASNIAGVGLSQALDRNYFEYEGNIEDLSALFYSIILFVCTNLVIAFTVVVLFSGYIASALLNNPGYGQLFIICAAGTFLTTLNGYCLIIFKNEGVAAQYATVGILQSVVTFCSTVIFLWYFEISVYAPAYGLLAGSVAGFGWSFRYILNRYRIKLSSDFLISSLKLSLPLVPHTLFGVFSTQFDKIFLGILGSLGGVGIYSVAQRVANVIFQLMTALDRTFIPRTYRELFDQNVHGAVDTTFLMPFFYLSQGFGLLVCLFSPELILLVFDEKYEAAIGLVAILTVFNTLMFFGKIHGTQLVFAKKTHLTSLLVMFGIMVNVGFNVPLIIQYGALGAAIGTTLASITMIFFAHRIAQRAATLDWKWGSILPLVICHLLAVALVTEFHRGDYRLLVELPTKFCVLLGYILIGVRLGLLNRNSLRAIYSLQKSDEVR